MRRGFTLIELIVVMTIAAVVLALGGLTFASYLRRTSARSAAQLFAQDLLAARGFAVRSQESVVIRFFESSKWYQVESQSTDTEIARRRFTGTGADMNLSAVELDVAGDSLVFSARGLLDMSGAGGTLGTASFSSGTTTYTVSFNGMGASKIEQT